MSRLYISGTFTVSLVMRCYWKVKLICTQASLLKLQTLCNCFCLFCEGPSVMISSQMGAVGFNSNTRGVVCFRNVGNFGGFPPPSPRLLLTSVKLHYHLGLVLAENN